MSAKNAGAFLKSHREWHLCSRQMSIRRTYRLKDFKTALVFMQKVGALAEKLNHHPDMMLTRYRYVRIRTTTTRVQRLTSLDLHFAEKSDQVYLSMV